MEKRDLDNKEEIIRNVVFGAMKFSMLNQDSVKDIIFDYDQALSFDGETGPYVQYTHARICSLLRKYGKKITKNVNFSLLDKEKKIIRLLQEFPEIVKKASEHYKPSEITHYLLDLSQAFNEYYHKHQILQDDKELEKARMLLVFCVKQILKTGLYLLGIEAPERM